jgi:4-amino-4-deoxy-L-arabinose transferase-like glycosyltransferase
VLLLSVCAWLVYAYVAIAVRRMAYPFDYYVGALSCRALGTGLFALRLVSFVASVGCFLLVYAIVQRDTRSRLLGVFGAALFLATFQLSGAWFDIARVDSLALFFTLAAIATAGSTRLWALALSGGLCALAFLTKQSACLVGPALFLQAALARKWHGAFALGGAFAVVAGAAALVLQATSDGWYTYYTFELPLAHSMGRNEHLIKGFWSLELLAPLPIAATLGLVALLGARSLAAAPAETASRERTPAPDTWFLSAVAVILVLSAWATRLHMGSAENDLMPAHAALALLSGRGLSQLLDSTSKTSRTWIVVCGVAILQLVLLAYEPDKQRASAERRPVSQRASGCAAKC